MAVHVAGIAAGLMPREIEKRVLHLGAQLYSKEAHGADPDGWKRYANWPLTDDGDLALLGE